MQLSNRAVLFLRRIAAAPSQGWSPGERWADDFIRDELDGYIPNVGGAGDMSILRSLVRKELVLKPYEFWHGLRVTDKGRKIVAQIIRREKEKGK